VPPRLHQVQDEIYAERCSLVEIKDTAEIRLSITAQAILMIASWRFSQAYRPKTLRGVLAVFDFGKKDEWPDSAIRPEQAIDGLREIADLKRLG
jgi:hypothetical protein